MIPAEAQEIELHSLAARTMLAHVRQPQKIRSDLYEDRGVCPSTGSGARVHAGTVTPSHGGVALLDLVEDTQGGEC